MCGLSKKKMPYLHLIDEAIGLLKIEMRIVKWRIKYPEQFNQHANNLYPSPLHLADKTSLVNIMEIVSSLYLSKRIVYENKQSVHLTDLGKGFEWLFNIKLGDYYQKHEDVIKRKPNKLTEFLNGLIALIRKEHEDKGYR
ncbi:RteC domain-containing protein [Parabacteroides distasonis]|uniref:RteC domain-containing protein n=1 Tax=Parabacteroides distasonis TaxID=823 RepID=UPI003F745E24